MKARVVDTWIEVGTPKLVRELPPEDRIATVGTGYGGNAIDVLKDVVRADWLRWLRANPSASRRSRAAKAMSTLEEPIPPTLDTVERWHVPVSIGDEAQTWRVSFSIN